jgi:hypothetical protein
VWFGPGAGAEASWREVNLLPATSKSGMQQQCASLSAAVSPPCGSHLCLYCMQAGIPIGGVMGTSAGALTGSLYAAGYSPRQVRSTLMLWQRATHKCRQHTCSVHGQHSATGLALHSGTGQELQMCSRCSIKMGFFAAQRHAGAAVLRACNPSCEFCPSVVLRAALSLIQLRSAAALTGGPATV